MSSQGIANRVPRGGRSGLSNPVGGGSIRARMFDRFTDRAKKVMSFSRLEALRLNHEYIAPEHMLLGIVEEGTGVAANVLKNMGVDLATVRSEVERSVEPGRSKVTMGQLPFTSGSKRVLEHSLEEASQFGHNYIGTEHLLLGLIRETDGIAGQVLQKLGVKLEAVRKEILEFIGEGEETGRNAQGGERRRAGAAALQRAVLGALHRARDIVPGSAYVVLPATPERGVGARDDRAAALYRDVIRPALRDAGATEVSNSQDRGAAAAVPLADRLRRAAMLIVVAVDRDPEVHFALGLALGLQCDPIVLSECAEDLPSELRSTPFLELVYDAAPLAKLREQLTAFARQRLRTKD